MTLMVNVEGTSHRVVQKTVAKKIVFEHLVLCGIGGNWNLRLGKKTRGSSQTPVLRVDPKKPNNSSPAIGLAIKLNGNGSVFRALLLVEGENSGQLLSCHTELIEWQNRGWKPLPKEIKPKTLATSRHVILVQPLPASEQPQGAIVPAAMEPEEQEPPLPLTLEPVKKKRIRKEPKNPIGSFTHNKERVGRLIELLKQKGVYGAIFSREQIKRLVRTVVVGNENTTLRGEGKVVGALCRNGFLDVHKSGLHPGKVSGYSLSAKAWPQLVVPGTEPSVTSVKQEDQSVAVLSVSPEIALQAAIDQTEQDLKSQKEKRDEFERQITALQAQIAGLNTEIEPLEIRLQRLKVSLATLQGKTLTEPQGAS